jgi:hypothetical protein
MTKEQTQDSINNIATLLTALDKLRDEIELIRFKSNLPDFESLQASEDSKLRYIGYMVEDAECALANVEGEAMDADKHLVKLSNELQVFINGKVA